MGMVIALGVLAAFVFLALARMRSHSAKQPADRGVGDIRRERGAALAALRRAAESSRPAELPEFRAHPTDPFAVWGGCVWNTETGQELRDLGDVEDACWSPNGGLLVTASSEREVHLAVHSWPKWSVVAEGAPDFDTNEGVGGVAIAMSNGGGFGALQLWTGQGAEGYIVFSLPALKQVASLPFVAGASISPCVFSPDDRRLAFLVGGDAWWWVGRNQAHENLADGGVVQWATLYVEDLREHRRSEHRIMVDLPEDWAPEDSVDTRPGALRFEGPERITLDVPWGAVCRVDLPAPAECRVPSPPPA